MFFSSVLNVTFVRFLLFGQISLLVCMSHESIHTYWLKCYIRKLTCYWFVPHMVPQTANNAFARTHSLIDLQASPCKSSSNHTPVINVHFSHLRTSSKCVTHEYTLLGKAACTFMLVATYRHHRRQNRGLKGVTAPLKIYMGGLAPLLIMQSKLATNQYTCSFNL